MLMTGSWHGNGLVSCMQYTDMCFASMRFLPLFRAKIDKEIKRGGGIIY
jgi:hypothetical protein